MKEIWLITGNLHKVNEARQVLKEYDIELLHYPTKRVEIQSDDPKKIAEYSLNQIPYNGHNHAVEDAGLFIDYYNGFPGPYSSFVLEKLDNQGILNLMKGIENRGAEYQSCIAFRFMGKIHFFKGIVRGKIAYSMQGKSGFGYDPIFIPDEGDGRTFGEMTNNEKNSISHRARSFRKLGEWFGKHF